MGCEQLMTPPDLEPVIGYKAFLDEFRSQANGHTLPELLINPQLDQALCISWHVHKSQVRNSGSPALVDHLIPVAISAQSVVHSPQEKLHLMCVGLLHDAIEDGDVPKAIGLAIKTDLGEQVLRDVMSLTITHDLEYNPFPKIEPNAIWDKSLSPKERRRMTETRRWQGRIPAMSHQARIVKLADLVNNTQDIVTRPISSAKMQQRKMLLQVLGTAAPTLASQLERNLNSIYYPGSHALA